MLGMFVLAGSAIAADGAIPDALAPWRQHVQVSRVLDMDCHSIHSYSNTSPESPDGRRVLFFRSEAADAHRGEICLVERETRKPRVLASDLIVEDAHRVACQQWLSGGRRVLFHDKRDDEWVVVSVDIKTGDEEILARGRQLAWGQPFGDVVPLYGPHWDPGGYRNLELLDVKTGHIRTVVTAEAVRGAYPEWVHGRFGDAPVSVFFPILSPDLRRVIFKMATSAGGGFRSSSGSRRYGLICYDLDADRFAYMHPKWGHPAWHSDSRRIVNMWGSGVVLIDTETGSVQSNPDRPPFPGGHPSVSPDGRLFATDVRAEALGGPKRHWAIVTGGFSSSDCTIIHQFDNSRGAASWRRSHPHPVFSPDGRRVYFNVSEDQWTRLYVAEPATDL
jgi:hypothetical protein